MTDRDESHPWRDEILDLVRRDPGIHKSEVGRRLDLSWGTLSHHISWLTRRGMLRAVKSGRQLTLFTPGIAYRFHDAFVALRGDASMDVITLLHKHSGATLAEVSKRLSCSRKVIRRHLQQLQGAGLVSRSPGHRGKFTLTPAALDEMLPELAPRQLGLGRLAPGGDSTPERRRSRYFTE